MRVEEEKIEEKIYYYIWEEDGILGRVWSSKGRDKKSHHIEVTQSDQMLRKKSGMS